MKQLILIAGIFFGIYGRSEFITPFKADLVPTQLTFQVVATDDVNPQQKSLRVAIAIKNVGALAVVPAVKPYPITIGNLNLSGYIYGPSASGGKLGDKIFPGQTGLYLLYLPLNSLRHCQGLNVVIDKNRELQKGKGVFLNDQKTLSAINTASIVACPGPLLP